MYNDKPYFYIYTITLARHLTDLGYHCEKLMPNPKKPWHDMYLFNNSPELAQEVEKYLEEKRNGEGEK